jgi:hypothetical protein
VAPAEWTAKSGPRPNSLTATFHPSLACGINSKDSGAFLGTIVFWRVDISPFGLDTPGLFLLLILSKSLSVCVLWLFCGSRI